MSYTIVAELLIDYNTGKVQLDVGGKNININSRLDAQKYLSAYNVKQMSVTPVEPGVSRIYYVLEKAPFALTTPPPPPAIKLFAPDFAPDINPFVVSRDRCQCCGGPIAHNGSCWC